ncbi:MAG: VWA domain-containing protein [Planctomycetota bacterium]|nr:VWA domain-containing protein [Planctomycetota bacterium]
MTQTITVSNNQEFFVVPLSDLDAAREDGFYVPVERNMTIVSDGEDLFEIPLNDLDAATADGFKDLLVRERTLFANGAMGAGKSRKSAKNKVAYRKLLAAIEADVPETVGEYVHIDAGAEDVSVDPNELVIETDYGDELVEDSSVEVAAVDAEAEQLRLEREQEIAEAEGFQKFWLRLKYSLPDEEESKRLSKVYGVTVIVHMLMLLCFGVYKLSKPDLLNAAPIISTQVDSDTLEDVVEPEDIVIQEVAASSQSDNANLELTSIVPTDFTATNGVLSGGAASSGFGTSFKGLDAGKSMKASFFGSESTASRFVFVVDNSLSMTQGRFETACNELLKTVSKMTPKQSFYVIFFSDTAYPMFYPQPAKQLIPATPANKKKLGQWLMTVPLCLKTNCREAMEAAFSLNPEVIYILGDGAFTDSTAIRLVEKKQPIPINTLGMQVSGSAEEQFKAIAEFNGGTYNDVGVDPKMAELAKRQPRGRVKTRSGIWGIKLDK